MKLLFLITCLAALASAGPIALPSDPLSVVSVGNNAVTVPLTLTDLGGGTWRASGDHAFNNGISVTVNATFNLDPFLDWEITFANGSAQAIQVFGSIVAPMLPGSYYATSRANAVMTDGATDGVFLLNPQIHTEFDLTSVPALSLGSNCSFFGTTRFANYTCGPYGPVSTQAVFIGSLGASVSTTVSAGDFVRFTGRTDLAPVPEPSAWIMVLSGVAMGMLRRLASGRA